MPVDASVCEFNGLCDDDSTTEPGLPGGKSLSFASAKRK
jgi:hypothetical protein